MWGKLIVSQVLAIPSAWASDSALAQMFNTSIPLYVPVGIWAFVSVYVIAKLK
jgi:hypothetical protein